MTQTNFKSFLILSSVDGGIPVEAADDDAVLRIIEILELRDGLRGSAPTYTFQYVGELEGLRPNVMLYALRIMRDASPMKPLNPWKTDNILPGEPGWVSGPETMSFEAAFERAMELARK